MGTDGVKRAVLSFLAFYVVGPAIGVGGTQTGWRMIGKLTLSTWPLLIVLPLVVLAVLPAAALALQERLR